MIKRSGVSRRILPRWRRLLALAQVRRRLIPWVEAATLLAAIAIAVLSYRVVTAPMPDDRLFSPAVIALLLIGNLIPGVALLVLLGRRIAKRRAARSAAGGGGQLHVRLVAIFSVIAAVPMLLVVIFASLLFQYGVEFWFSDRARGMLENATIVAQEFNDESRVRVERNTVAMASDVVDYLREAPIDSPLFQEGLAGQLYQRELSEGAIIVIRPDVGEQTLAMVDPYERGEVRRIDKPTLDRLRGGAASVVINSGDRIEAVTPLAVDEEAYLWTARVVDPQMLASSARAAAVTADYKALLGRSRALQLQFNVALLVIALLIVGAAVLAALAVADRLVRPVGDLVDAAQRVTGGDLSARVANTGGRDEIGRLASAFNRMTRRLQEQTGALDSRRALIEAVLSGVTAGVVSIDRERRVRLMNGAAAALIKAPGVTPEGAPLVELAPELDALVGEGESGGIVHLTLGGEARTLAVRVAEAQAGHVLTFDDITQQLLDQRRAAWSDVARRIAHEIKNPLTPIQLAAERLQRRYGKQIADEDGTFARLTETIIRQVADLRRMVDEFSSFARMPKPVFCAESLTDIARQALFLHEVAHPVIAFTLDAEDGVEMVCDRRQLGQALTNLVKNAAEAIERRQESAPTDFRGAVMISIANGERVTVSVADNGTGLPEQRERLTEPYMTTRARGTGLGLAIVKKIVEEHFGTMSLNDNPGGGTIVALAFDPALLAPLAGTGDAIDEPTQLARNG